MPLTRCKRCIDAIQACADVLSELMALEPDTLPPTVDWPEIQRTLATYADEAARDREAWVAYSARLRELAPPPSQIVVGADPG